MNDKINGRTPEEIKKGLECCSKDEDGCNCSNCLYNLGELSCKCIPMTQRDALALIQQLERERDAAVQAAQPKWISVEERLPEDEVVAANFAPGTYGYKEYILGYVCPPRNTEPGGCYAINDYEILHNVTHWLPLPPAPNDNKEEQS